VSGKQTDCIYPNRDKIYLWNIISYD